MSDTEKQSAGNGSVSDDLFSPGDLVEVLCPGLATLRNICPDMPPNHHGKVSEIWDDGMILVEFPIGDDDPEEHSQAAPYPRDQVRLREND